MKDNSQKLEYWYDVYGLSERRDVATIEAFLCRFSDRQKIESKKKDLIFLIPNIPISEKNKLFESRYSFDIERRGRLARAFDYISRPEPEIVRGITISQALELGVARRNHSFSLYIRNYTRKDIKCLLVHFTEDNKVILGVAVDEKGESGKDNWPYAQKIKQELESVVPTKFSTIWFEQYPLDSEAEFIKANEYFGDLNEDKKEFARYPHIPFPNDPSKGAYYFTYRNQSHRHYRELLYEPNLTDYFALGDNKGQIVNVISFQGDILRERNVQNPQANDVVKLQYLGDLLKKAISWGTTDFNPTTILRVSIPPGARTEPIWQGHRDRVSDFTTYEGVKTTRLVIEDTYHLNKLEDLKRLAEEGFFQFNEAFFHSSTAQAYEEWLIKNHYSQLYLDILLDEAALLKLNVNTLLELFGKQNWPTFLSYLLKFQVDQEALKALLKDMCYSDSWSAGQVADILHMVSITNEELEELLNIFTPHFPYNIFRNTNPRQSEKYQLLKSTRKEPPTLTYLISQMKAGMDYEPSSKVIPIIFSHLQIIEKEYGSFHDNYLIFRWATKESYKDILLFALKLLPEDKRRSRNLLNIGLITGNDAILQNLTLSSSDIEKIRQEVVAPLLDTKENLTQLIKSTTCRRNYFQVAHLAPQVDPKDLVNPVLEACKEGLVGIVKILVEQGHVAPDCFYNSPIKYANKEGFYLLRLYLLSKGVRDEIF